MCPKGVRPMAELIGRLQPNFGSQVRASPPPPKILPSKNHHVEIITRHLAARSGTSLFKPVAGKSETSSSRRNHHDASNSNQWREKSLNPPRGSSSRRASHTSRKIGEEREETSNLDHTANQLGFEFALLYKGRSCPTCDPPAPTT